MRVIDSQVHSARQRIEQEKIAFEKKKHDRLAALDVRYAPKISALTTNEPAVAPEEVNMDESTGPADKDTDVAPPPPPQQDADTMVDEPYEASPAEVEQSTTFLAETQASHDLHDDKDRGIMVETEEDTVIY